MNIVMCGDRNTVKPLAVVLSSLVRSQEKPRDLAVFIVESGWTGEDKELVRRAGEPMSVTFAAAGDLASLPVRRGWHVTGAAYLLLDIPGAFRSLDRCIYLDYDVLVRTPLDELWSTKLNEYSTAAVREGNRPSIGASEAGLAWRRLGLDPRAPMLNSGVLVMDLERWRNDGIAEKAAGIARRSESALRFADQDAVNIALNGAWLQLHPRWNVRGSMYNDKSGLYAVFETSHLDAARENPAIVHFAGRSKPWQRSCNQLFREEWRTIAAGIGWRPWENNSVAAGAVESYRDLRLRLFRFVSRESRKRVKQYYLD